MWTEKEKKNIKKLKKEKVKVLPNIGCGQIIQYSKFRRNIFITI